MENHREKYRNLMRDARAAQQHGLYRDAIKQALDSWEHIDGMMQYERRYEDREFDSVEGIDMVLKYAPLLLDFHSLERLEGLLTGQRRIDRNTSDSLAEHLAKARALMWDVHRLWDHLEHHPGTRQDELRQILGGEQDQWRTAAEIWEKMGLVHRTPEGRSYRLALSTRMGETVSAKCPACGVVADAPKAMFLEMSTCPKCRAKVLFVILSKRAPTMTEE